MSEVIKNPTDEPKINPRPITKNTDYITFLSIPKPSYFLSKTFLRFTELITTYSFLVHVILEMY